MSGKASRDKGARVERQFVNLLKKEGVKAEKVPLSGACGGNYSGDIRLWVDCCGLIPTLEYQAEVKSRKNGEGFKTIEKWLDGNSMLFLKKNRADPMVVMTWGSFLSLCTGHRC